MRENLKLSRPKLEEAFGHAIATIGRGHEIISSLLEQKGAPMLAVENYFGNMAALFEVTGHDGDLIGTGLDELEGEITDWFQPRNAKMARRGLAGKEGA